MKTSIVITKLSRENLDGPPPQFPEAHWGRTQKAALAFAAVCVQLQVCLAVDDVRSMSNKEVAQILCEFFEVAIHAILYCRKVYPKEVFERARKYGVMTYQSRHPQLNAYIRDAVGSLQPLLERRAVRQLSVDIDAESDGDSGDGGEQFCFDFETVPDAALHASDALVPAGLSLEAAEAALRACLQRIVVADALLPVRSARTFRVSVVAARSPQVGTWEPVGYQGDTAAIAAGATATGAPLASVSAAGAAAAAAAHIKSMSEAAQRVCTPLRALRIADLLVHVYVLSPKSLS